MEANRPKLLPTEAQPWHKLVHRDKYSIVQHARIWERMKANSLDSSVLKLCFVTTLCTRVKYCPACSYMGEDRDDVSVNEATV
jgi:hypothetical protein